jgi:hypothetical protein
MYRVVNFVKPGVASVDFNFLNQKFISRAQ